jgi:hypothetical protein
MKGKVALGIVALFAFAVSPVVANASSTAYRHDQVLTGCLASGESAGHYKLIGQDGASWTVKQGEYVDLAPYVGRTVTVAGPEVRYHAKNESKTEGRLTARDVAVDGESCQQ